MTEPGAAQIQNNIERVRERITAACANVGRDPETVTLVAVSKGKPADAIVTAVNCGLQHFGENRVEESMQKIPLVAEQVSHKLHWHMIGHVQSRKARHIPTLYEVLHSVDSLSLAQKLSRLLDGSGQSLDVLVQMNVAGEEQKYGLEASRWQSDAQEREQLVDVVGQISQLAGLTVRGLMTMAPLVADMEATRPVFAGIAALRNELESQLGLALPELSMGMTDDYPVAIEEGATMVRVGRAIFGERYA